jgi:hypothetical protein
MKELGFNDLSVIPMYVPFVHPYKDGEDYYVEALVKVKIGETIEITMTPISDPVYIYLTVKTPVTSVTSETGNLIYTDPIPLLPMPHPEARVFVTVVTPEIGSEEAATAIVRYRDVP